MAVAVSRTEGERCDMKKRLLVDEGRGRSIEELGRKMVTGSSGLLVVRLRVFGDRKQGRASDTLAESLLGRAEGTLCALVPEFARVSMVDWEPGSLQVSSTLILLMHRNPEEPRTRRVPLGAAGSFSVPCSMLIFGSRRRETERSSRDEQFHPRR